MKKWLGSQIESFAAKMEMKRMIDVPPTRPLRLIMFPWGARTNGSCNLRAYALKPELEALGWDVAVVPHTLSLAQRRAVLDVWRPSAVLLEKSRHPLNRPALYREIPAVFDLDDADYADATEIEGVVDCCRGSAAVVAGSRAVAQWCSQYNPNISVIWTGSPVPPTRPTVPAARRRSIVAWATVSLSRTRREVAMLKQIIPLVQRQVPLELWICGAPKPRHIASDLADFAAAGVTVRAVPLMGYEPFIRTLESAAVGLHIIAPGNEFAMGKSFGKVLAYMSADVAVVASSAIDNDLFFQHGRNGMLAAGIEGWVDSIVKLLKESDFRQSIVDNAYVDFCNKLSTRAAAVQLDRVLRSTVGANHCPA